MKLTFALLFALLWAVSPPLAPMVLPEAPRLEDVRKGTSYPT